MNMTKEELVAEVKNLLKESLQGYVNNYAWHYMWFYKGDGQKIGEIHAHQYNVYDSIDPGDRSSELYDFVKNVLPFVTHVEEFRGNSWADEDDEWRYVVVDNIAPVEKIRRRVRDALNKAPADTVFHIAIEMGVKLSK